MEIFETRLKNILRELQMQKIQKMFLIPHDEYKQMDKKKIASLIKAAKCLCYGLQLFSYDQNYPDP